MYLNFTFSPNDDKKDNRQNDEVKLSPIKSSSTRKTKRILDSSDEEDIENETLAANKDDSIVETKASRKD